MESVRSQGKLLAHGNLELIENVLLEEDPLAPAIVTNLHLELELGVDSHEFAVLLLQNVEAAVADEGHEVPLVQNHEV